jgi:hypothetical protein
MRIRQTPKGARMRNADFNRGQNEYGGKGPRVSGWLTHGIFI